MDSLTKLDQMSNKKTESKSENQSLLGAVEPLDWLFTADSEPEPLSSPKLVNKTLTDDISIKPENKGAIPKRPRVPRQSDSIEEALEDLKDEDAERAR